MHTPSTGSQDGKRNTFGLLLRAALYSGHSTPVDIGAFAEKEVIQ